MTSSTVQAIRSLPIGGNLATVQNRHVEAKPELSDIEAARAEDLPLVAQLLRRVGLPFADLHAQFPEAFVVVRSGAAIVATAGLELHRDSALLRSVAVDAAFRGRGLGRRLVEDRLSAGSQSGASRVYLLANTAYEFFVSLGFEPMRRSESPPALAAASEFASICPASAPCLIWSFDKGCDRVGQEGIESSSNKAPEAQRKDLAAG